MVLIIFQVYEVSEGQKRTITSASDAQQNAAYGLFLIGQDLMGAGQVISAATVLSGARTGVAGRRAGVAPRR